MSLGRALSHPLRHRLLFEYLSGPTSPAELARRLSQPLNRVAYHTGVLARHGYIELVRTERRRGALTRFYRAGVAPSIDGVDWEQLPDRVRRALALGAVGLALDDARAAIFDDGFDDAQVQMTRSPLRLDDEGVEAVAALLRDLSEAIHGSFARSRARAAPAMPYEIVLLAFECPPGIDAASPD